MKNTSSDARWELLKVRVKLHTPEAHLNYITNAIEPNEKTDGKEYTKR